MTSIRQLSFSGGELTPSVWGRSDIAKHNAGLKLCKNFFVMRHGGVANRAGTVFIGEVKDSTQDVRLVEFIFNLEQTYVLEFGNQYIRFIRNNSHVKDYTATITGVTNANPAIVTSAGHSLSNGDEIYITDVSGMTEVNVRNFKVANVTANTFALVEMSGDNLNSTDYAIYISGGTASRIYTLPTSYLESELFDLYIVQSADVLHIVHPSHPPAELSRTGHANWTLANTVFGPTIGTPTGGSSSASGTTYYYAVTAVDATTSEESLQSSDIGSSTRTSTLSWTAVTGAGYYNIYYKTNGIYAWIGLAGATSFTDNTLTANPLDTPPVNRILFGSAGDYPSTVSLYQQRLLLGNTTNNPEAIWGSRSGLRKNFNVSSPVQADDAISFSLAGTRVQSIRHIFSAAKLLILTDSGEWTVDGDGAGVITPTDINPRQQTANGSSTVNPLLVEGSALYIQARGSVMRDLNYDFQTDGYRGNELSIFASHLVDNHTIKDWGYQQIPHSIIWMVREDGVVLGMTYVREHALFGWHQHDFGGAVESVAVVPTSIRSISNEDTLYIVVNRVVNGRDVKYIEYLNTRSIVDIEDCIFSDSSLSYDGRNSSSATVTLTSPGTWTYEDTITITCDTALFDSSYTNKALVITNDTGDIVRITVTGYTSTTVLTGTPHNTVASDLRNVPLTTWSTAVSMVTGLWHLEGKDVSCLVDGTVSSNPLNSSYSTRTVTSGKIIFDDPHAVIHVGLPVMAELRTLDYDRSDNIVTNKSKQISKLYLQVESSRGIFAGVDSDYLTELKIRSTEAYGEPVSLATGIVEMNILGTWDKQGSVYIQQTDPLPLSILGITAEGFLPGGSQ
jgi:hypothetical protein